MTDAQEDEMAEWLKKHPEMYNKGKEYRDMDRKEAAWATHAKAMGMESEFHLPLHYYLFIILGYHVIIFILFEVLCVE